MSLGLSNDEVQIVILLWLLAVQTVPLATRVHRMLAAWYKSRRLKRQTGPWHLSEQASFCNEATEFVGNEAKRRLWLMRTRPDDAA